MEPSTSTDGWWHVVIGSGPTSTITGEFRIRPFAIEHADLVRAALAPLLTRAREEGRRLGLEQALRVCWQLNEYDGVDGDVARGGRQATTTIYQRIQKLANGVEG